MAPLSILDLVSALPSDDTWGPAVTTEKTLDGVPYAPFSKGDKLGRMADWSSEGKDGRDGRSGRQAYNRNYRGMAFPWNSKARLFSFVRGTFSTNGSWYRSTSIRCWDWQLVRCSGRRR